MTDGETFGDRLRTVRERWGMSPAELGEASGMEAEAIEGAEAGTATPDAAIVDRLAEALRVRVERLATGEGPMDPRGYRASGLHPRSASGGLIWHSR